MKPTRIVLAVVAMLAFSFMFGCLESPKDYTCCLRSAAKENPARCVMFNSSDPQQTVDYSAVTNSCNITASTCNITSKEGYISGVWPLIITTPPEYATVQICSEIAPKQCIDPKCRAMICGDFEFRPKIPSYVEDAEKVPPESETSGAINLYHGQCMFMPMDYKLGTLMKNSASYLSRFRIGLGTTFDEYAEYSAYFPVSDKFCNMNPLGTVDRYQNYLTTDMKKYDPVVKINSSCVSDQDPASAPEPLKLGSLNLGDDGQPVTGYKQADYIREVAFLDGSTEHYYMTPYTLPDPKFYKAELQKRYMDEAYNFTMWVIKVNDKLKNANISMGYMNPACLVCAGICDDLQTCADAEIYNKKCKSDWDKYDQYLANKAAAEAEVKKAVGEKPLAAPKALYECDPGNALECFSSRCSTERYSRVNLFVSGQEVALPCEHTTVRAPNYDLMDYSDDLKGDFKEVYQISMGPVMGAPYQDYDVLTCEPTTDITFSGGSVGVHSLASADYRQPGSDSFTTGIAQDIVLFSYDKARYPAAHVEATGELTEGGEQFNVCPSGWNCNSVYGADYVKGGKDPIVGYAVMNGEDFPKTLFARLCQLKSTDYQVVDISNYSVCGRDQHAPVGSCMVAKDTLTGTIGGLQCYNTLPCLTQGGGIDTTGFFYETGCTIQGQGSCWNTEVSPNLADSYFGLSRTFGSGALYNGQAQSWSDFPQEIMPQFLKDLKTIHSRDGDTVDFQKNRYMCLSPDNDAGPNFDTSADCLADVPNTPKQIVLITGLGACDYEMKPGAFPKIKEYGWCESCSLATMAYQKVERSDMPYVPLNEVGYSSLDGEPQTHKSGGLAGPVVYSGSQISGNFTSKPICTWDTEKNIMRCNTSKDFEPYHKQNPKSIGAPQTEPEATYIKQQMARFLQSGVIPILDMSSNSVWTPFNSLVTVQEAGQKQKCKEQRDAKIQSDCYPPPGLMTPEICSQAITAQYDCDNKPDTQTVQKTVGEYEATRLIYNMGATIVIVESTERLDDQVMRDNIKSRGTTIKKDCPRCLTAVRVTGYDNATFTSNLERVFKGRNCFGGIGGMGAGECDMQIADDPLFGVDIVIFDYAVTKNKAAYASATNPKDKADMVMKDLQDHGYYIVKNYNKPSIVFDFYVSQKDPTGVENDPDAWNKDEVNQLFTELIAKEDELVKGGITGVFYARVKTVPFPDSEITVSMNWTKLESTPSLYKHQSFCALSESMLRMVAEKPMTFFQKKFATPSVGCVECSFAEQYSGTCSRTCANGIECTPSAEATALSALKCPEGGIPDPCTLCNETHKTYTCTIEYENGTVATMDIDSKDISSSSYADVIAGLDTPDKCCLNSGTSNYTFVEQSVALSVNAPVVFSKSGDENIDCSFPSASSAGTEGQQFCNVKSGATNYRVSCMAKDKYEQLSIQGAFKDGFDFSKSYAKMVFQGSGGNEPAKIADMSIFSSGSASVKNLGAFGSGGNVVISGSGMVKDIFDPCLMNTSGGGNGSSGGTPAGCDAQTMACSDFAKRWEESMQQNCTDFFTLCQEQPWVTSQAYDITYCPQKSQCDNLHDAYCAKVRKKYGDINKECRDTCCKKPCVGNICPPDPRDPSKPAEGCVIEMCAQGICKEADRDLQCENQCIAQNNPANIIVDPEYPWGPGGDKETETCGDPCGVKPVCQQQVK